MLILVRLVYIGSDLFFLSTLAPLRQASDYMDSKGDMQRYITQNVPRDGDKVIGHMYIALAPGKE